LAQKVELETLKTTQELLSNRSVLRLTLSQSFPAKNQALGGFGERPIHSEICAPPGNVQVNHQPSRHFALPCLGRAQVGQHL
jgi:hypothetical protein